MTVTAFRRNHSLHSAQNVASSSSQRRLRFRRSRSQCSACRCCSWPRSEGSLQLLLQPSNPTHPPPTPHSVLNDHKPYRTPPPPPPNHPHHAALHNLLHPPPPPLSPLHSQNQAKPPPFLLLNNQHPPSNRHPLPLPLPQPQQQKRPNPNPPNLRRLPKINFTDPPQPPKRFIIRSKPLPPLHPCSRHSLHLLNHASEWNGYKSDLSINHKR